MAIQDFRDDGWFDWAYKGVDHALPGNGGPECRDFLSLSQRCWESVVASLVALVALLYAYPRLRLPRPCSYRPKEEPLGKRLLLLLMCLTFGIELGFKLATRQMIWIGNPCHLATMMQIFILAAPPSRIVTAAFRLHMHMLTGAPIAILFPVINTRLLPFETGVYFLQHVLMLVIPFYLMQTGDPFIPEELSDFSWAMVSFGFLFIYHFLPLQFLAYVSQVNLNNMLCPAVSDPFHGRFYRLFAICHQLILIPTLGKLFVVLAKAMGIMPCDNPQDSGNMSDVFVCESKGYPCCQTNTCSSSNVSMDSSVRNGSGNTSEADSGCVGSTSLCHCQDRGHDRSPPAVMCCHGDNQHQASPCGCPCKSCGNTAENQVAVRHIINGQMVDGGAGGEQECYCRRRSSHFTADSGAALDVDGNRKNSHQLSFLLNDTSRSSVGHDRGIDKSLHMSDLTKSKNGHAKAH